MDKALGRMTARQVAGITKATTYPALSTLALRRAMVVNGESLHLQSISLVDILLVCTTAELHVANSN